MYNFKTLLVDDEEEFVTTLAERLELRGIQTQIASTGESALRLFEADLPHVVVLDVMMPGMGGLEVLQRLKAINSKIPVILLTGHGAEKEGIEGKRLGAFDYLMKPLNIEDLIKKMLEAVEKV
jgi:DNA-binding response OmpR family regulator